MNTEKPSRCPLCERPNHCAIATARPATECWCMTATISDKARQRADAKAEAPRRCLCPACGAEG